MNEQWDCLKTAREELMPRLETLGKMAEGLGGEDRARILLLAISSCSRCKNPNTGTAPYRTYWDASATPEDRACRS